MADSPAVKTSQ